MTFVAKPRTHHPLLRVNDLGLTRRDYEGSVSTLCAGCGHDSVSAAVVQACAELALPPHKFAKVSGIGCSSKTPSYFLGNSHGFNSVHGAHAVGGHRREPRQPGALLCGRFRRRRQRQHRHRPVSRTSSAAASTCCIWWTTTAPTASPRGSSPPPTTAAPPARRACRTSTSPST